ncbi:MAG: hypothetical protein QXU99_05045 [Candidatus Bathyarchaeia archaeon]
MDKVRLVLAVVTMAITVSPIAGVLLIYRDNLLGLVFPDELRNIINEGIPSSEINEGISFSDTLGNISLIDSSYDPASRTVVLTFKVTNPFDFAISVSAFSADVHCAAHNMRMGYITLGNEVQIEAGATSTVTILGRWTEAAVKHFETFHAGERSIDVELTGLNLTVNGVTIQSTENIRVPSFPVS